MERERNEEKEELIKYKLKVEKMTEKKVKEGKCELGRESGRKNKGKGKKRKITETWVISLLPQRIKRHNY